MVNFSVEFDQLHHDNPSPMLHRRNPTTAIKLLKTLITIPASCCLAGIVVFIFESTISYLKTLKQNPYIINVALHSVRVQID